MERLWTRMSSVYGADRWERAYGAQWSHDWLHALGSCTLADLSRVVEKAQRDDSGRLPTLGQVIMFARQWQPGTFAGNAPPAPLPTLKQLAKPDRRDSAVAAKHRAMIKRLTAGERLTRAELDELPALKSGQEYFYPGIVCQAREEVEA